MSELKIIEIAKVPLVIIALEEYKKFENGMEYQKKELQMRRKENNSLSEANQKLLKEIGNLKNALKGNLEIYEEENLKLSNKVSLLESEKRKLEKEISEYKKMSLKIKEELEKEKIIFFRDVPF